MFTFTAISAFYQNLKSNAFCWDLFQERFKYLFTKYFIFTWNRNKSFYLCSTTYVV